MSEHPTDRSPSGVKSWPNCRCGHHMRDHWPILRYGIRPCATCGGSCRDYRANDVDQRDGTDDMKAVAEATNLTLKRVLDALGLHGAFSADTLVARVQQIAERASSPHESIEELRSGLHTPYNDYTDTERNVRGRFAKACPWLSASSIERMVEALIEELEVRASSPPPPVSPDRTTTRSRASERSDVGARQDLREVPDTKGSER